MQLCYNRPEQNGEIWTGECQKTTNGIRFIHSVKTAQLPHPRWSAAAWDAFSLLIVWSPAGRQTVHGSGKHDVEWKRCRWKGRRSQVPGKHSWMCTRCWRLWCSASRKYVVYMRWFTYLANPSQPTHTGREPVDQWSCVPTRAVVEQVASSAYRPVGRKTVSGCRLLLGEKECEGSNANYICFQGNCGPKASVRPPTAMTQPSSVLTPLHFPSPFAPPPV